jgi:HEAT repeat protein
MELARSGDRRALEQLVHYLEEGDGTTRHLAARALETRGEPAIDLLTLALWSCDVEGRRYVIRALDHIGTSRARQALLPVLTLEAEEAYYDLVRIDALSALGEAGAVALLRDSLHQRVDRARRNASQVLRAVFLGEPGMRLILSNLNHPDRFIRASAIEALEVRVDPVLLGGILPLFEHESPQSIAEHGSTYFDLPSRPPLDVLTELTRHRSAWIRACAVFALGQVGSRELLSRIEALTDDDDELTRLNAVEAIGKLGDARSLPLLERLAEGAKGKLLVYASAAMRAIGAREAMARPSRRTVG